MINLNDAAAASSISVSFQELNIKGSYTARNVWTGEVMKLAESITVSNVTSHASYFFKLIPN